MVLFVFDDNDNLNVAKICEVSKIQFKKKFFLFIQKFFFL